jgi:hypothetical protein
MWGFVVASLKRIIETVCNYTNTHVWCNFKGRLFHSVTMAMSSLRFKSHLKTWLRTGIWWSRRATSAGTGIASRTKRSIKPQHRPRDPRESIPWYMHGDYCARSVSCARWFNRHSSTWPPIAYLDSLALLLTLDLGATLHFESNTRCSVCAEPANRFYCVSKHLLVPRNSCKCLTGKSIVIEKMWVFANSSVSHSFIVFTVSVAQHKCLPLSTEFHLTL